MKKLALLTLSSNTNATIVKKGFSFALSGSNPITVSEVTWGHLSYSPSVSQEIAFVTNLLVSAPEYHAAASFLKIRTTWLLTASSPSAQVAQCIATVWMTVDTCSLPSDLHLHDALNKCQTKVLAALAEAMPRLVLSKDFSWQISMEDASAAYEKIEALAWTSIGAAPEVKEAEEVKREYPDRTARARISQVDSPRA